VSLFNTDAVTDFEEIPLVVNRNITLITPSLCLCPRSEKTVCRHLLGQTASGANIVFDHQVLALFFPKIKHKATSDSILNQQPQSTHHDACLDRALSYSTKTCIGSKKKNERRSFERSVISLFERMF
jgi:hypothetical protein